MASYADTFAILAERAVSQTAIDIRAFVMRLVQQRVTEETLLRMLDEDLLNDGPIFGKFVRSMTGAAVGATVSAARQGEIVGHISGTAELESLVAKAGIEGDILAVMDNADPDLAAQLEAEVLADQQFAWVAELLNTCHRCLPLHGTQDTLNGWASRGLHPDSIHSGWDNPCHCRFVESALMNGARKSLLAPLRRVRQEAPKGQRKTARAVTQRDIEASLKARDDAMQSKEGRAMLRALGQAGAANDG